MNKILSITEPKKTNSSYGNYVCLTEVEIPVGDHKTNMDFYFFKKIKAIEFYNTVLCSIKKEGYYYAK